MFRGDSQGRAARSTPFDWRWEIIGASILITLSILIHRVNHDESQYVAAIALMRNGWPYLDFAYLQTPLQPFLYSPLTFIRAGWLMVAVRLVNGTTAIITVAILGAALSGKVDPRTRLIALATLICSESFLLAGTLARNDALPMAFLAAAILVLFKALQKDRAGASFALAGLLLGLAASAKINAAVPAAGAALFVLLRIRSIKSRSVAAFLAAGLIGLAPCATFAILAPDQFRFDVFTYSLEAPIQWWTSVGKGHLLSWRGIPTLFSLAGRGVVLVGLAATAADRRRTDETRLLDFMIAGGIIAAYLTQPPFPQYLVPLLPPLTIRFAMALDRFHGQTTRRVILTATLISCALGLEGTVHDLVRTRKHGLELVRAVAIGRKVAMLSNNRLIATLSPELIAGADTKLDRRFVAGPFLFRTSGSLAEQALRYAYSPNWQHLDRALDEQPPDMVLVGGEERPQPPLYPHGLDAPLRAWAQSRDYRPIPLGGGFTLFVHP